jgi:hypothetical protein
MNFQLGKIPPENMPRIDTGIQAALLYDEVAHCGYSSMSNTEKS